MRQEVTDYSVAMVPGPWEHQFIPANSTRLHAALAGPESGQLVVLLHGFGQFWWAWRGVIPALAAAGYRVVALDLRGVAASDKPPTGYDVPTRTRDVAAVIRSLGRREAVVVGHGTGGEVAWAMGALQPAVTTAVAALACAHPARLHTTFLGSLTPEARRLFAFAQLPMLPERRLRENALGLIFARGIDSSLADDGTAATRRPTIHLGPRRPARVTKAISAPSAISWGRWAEHPFPDDVVEKYREAIRIPFAAHTSVEPLRWLVRSAQRPDGLRYRSALRRPLGIPALQIQGTRDGYVHAETASADAAALFRDYTYLLVENAGHYLLDEYPEQVAAALIDWLP